MDLKRNLAKDILANWLEVKLKLFYRLRCYKTFVMLQARYLFLQGVYAEQAHHLYEGEWIRGVQILIMYHIYGKDCHTSGPDAT